MKQTAKETVCWLLGVDVGWTDHQWMDLFSVLRTGRKGSETVGLINVALWVLEWQRASGVDVTERRAWLVEQNKLVGTAFVVPASNLVALVEPLPATE